MVQFRAFAKDHARAQSRIHHGNKAAAVAKYRKSLQRNPGNTNAVKMLERLGAAAGTKPRQAA